MYDIPPLSKTITIEMDTFEHKYIVISNKYRKNLKK